MPITLVVEDGTGLTNSNTYSSEADCAAYHAEMGNAAWAAETDADAKAAALIQATRYLDHHYLGSWKGYRVSDAQPLEWPRVAAYDEQGYEFPAVPREVKRAAQELALRALSGQLLADEDRGGAVRRVKVGEIEQEFEPGAPAGKAFRQVEEILTRVLDAKPSASGVRIART